MLGRDRKKRRNYVFLVLLVDGLVVLAVLCLCGFLLVANPGMVDNLLGFPTLVPTAEPLPTAAWTAVPNFPPRSTTPTAQPTVLPTPTLTAAEEVQTLAQETELDGQSETGDPTRWNYQLRSSLPVRALKFDACVGSAPLIVESDNQPQISWSPPVTSADLQTVGGDPRTCRVFVKGTQSNEWIELVER